MDDGSLSARPSLPEAHRTIPIPVGAGFWRKLLAFSGPGYLVAVGLWVLCEVAITACDLIALTSHGHRLLSDVFHGTTIVRVRHNTAIPLLIVRAKA